MFLKRKLINRREEYNQKLDKLNMLYISYQIGDEYYDSQRLSIIHRRDEITDILKEFFHYE